ncbi:hypothetical protein HMPREF3190_00813 [Umbribacter vaginalis]|nr:hypothetical protein HMPREF3190_00813 [Coriobacteriales bacterium DNF00809]
MAQKAHDKGERYQRTVPAGCKGEACGRTASTNRTSEAHGQA